MKKLVIVGNGGFAREVEWLVERINNQRITWDFLGFIDDNQSSDKVIGNVLNIGGVFSKVFGIAGIVGLVVAGLGLLESKFGEQINSILSMVTEKGPQIVSNFINGIVSKIPDLIAKGGELLQNFLNALIANLPVIIKGGMQVISSLVIRNIKTITNANTKNY